MAQNPTDPYNAQYVDSIFSEFKEKRKVLVYHLMNNPKIEESEKNKIQDEINVYDQAILSMKKLLMKVLIEFPNQLSLANLHLSPHISKGGKRRRSVKKSTKKSKKVHTGGKRKRSVKKSTKKSKKVHTGGKRKRSVKKSRK
jgi:hypothetical protein